LQYATSHNLGDNFAKAFDIKFLDEVNEYQYAWQTSWGLSTRSIGALIMSHSDDKGLVLPPKMAQTKIVILPIVKAENREVVVGACNKLRESLIENENFNGFKNVLVDETDKRLGEKHYHWERLGTPVRIEIGERDIADGVVIAVRRDTGEKIKIENANLFDSLVDILKKIQNDLFDNAKNRTDSSIVSVSNWDDFTKAINEGKAVLAHYDNTAQTEKIIKDETGATVRCVPFDVEQVDGVCVKTGRPSNQKVLFAKAY
jgi:prolyl-tRNA synthetase